MRYRQGVQHLTVCCTPVQINISLTPKLHIYRGAGMFCMIILYVNDGVEAYIFQRYEATNQESDLAKDPNEKLPTVSTRSSLYGSGSSK